MRARHRVLLAAAILAVGAWKLAPEAQAAFTITGVVTNEVGAGVANVDLDFVNLCSGDSVFLVNDKTAANGAYSIVVNPGIYDIRYTPPTGSTVAAAELKSYTVSANADLGTTTLYAGWLVSGVVHNTSSAGIAGVSLKFVDAATGSRVYAGKDVTTATGAYAVRVRTGTYDVEYRPPAGAAYATVRRSSLVVAGNVSGLVDVLPAGVNVQGTVKDSLNVAVKNVDLNFYDTCTGNKIPTANDNTSATGAYSLYVPPGTYSIYFHPPVICQALESERLTDQLITQNTGLGNTTLQSAVTVSGQVRDDLGVPLAAAEFEFYHAQTGVRQAATHDTTDAAGNFSFYVPVDTYNINVEPPVGRDLVLRRLEGVGVPGPVSLGTITLDAGDPVSGMLVSPGGGGVKYVNVNAVDSVTRVAVRLAHDRTAQDGTFRVVVPAGTYDFQYTPPGCTGLAPADQKNVAVTGSTNLPTLHLVAGVHATGLVVDGQAAPVDNVDLDLFFAGTGVKAYTPNDTTNASGAYDVFIAPGTYDIDYVPPSSTALRPAQRFAVAIPVNTNIPVTVLPDGLVVSGLVHSSVSGLPVSSVKVDFYTPGTSTPLFTVHNSTNSSGSYAVVVVAGTWDILYTPDVGSGLAPRWRRGVAVFSDLSLPDTQLLPLTVPGVASIVPASGSTAGGQAVVINGSGFQPDATVKLGGVGATGVAYISAIKLNAVTPPHPAALVSLQVINPGNQVGSLTPAYTYVESAHPITLSLSKSGSNVVLNWTSTGQSTYTVFRAPSPTGFTGSSILTTTAATTYTDLGAAAGGGVQFYQVD